MLDESFDESWITVFLPTDRKSATYMYKKTNQILYNLTEFSYLIVHTK